MNMSVRSVHLHIQYDASYLLGEGFPRAFHEISSQASDEAHREMRLAADLIEVRQSVHDDSDQARVHHKVILKITNIG